MDKKYYLNNTSKESIQLNLTKVRTIKPLSSLALNIKDIAIVKKLKADRKGKPSKLDALVLSTIKIEDDCRYNADAAKEAAKEAAKADKAAKAAAKKADEAAKKELEAQIKAEEEQKVLEERKAIEEMLKEEAAKDGKTFDEESLQKAVDEYLKALDNPSK